MSDINPNLEAGDQNEASTEKLEKPTGLTITADGQAGAIRVSANVIAQIIKKDVLAVEGVARFAPKGIRDLMNVFSDRSFDSSIDIQFSNNKIAITLALVLYYGVHLPSTITAVQQAVKNDIEHLIGAPVERVDVTVIDLVAQEEAEPEAAEQPAEEAPAAPAADNI